VQEAEAVRKNPKQPNKIQIPHKKKQDAKEGGELG